MKILSAPYEFDWDRHNIGHIRTRHKVEPAECEEVFFNLPFTIRPDVQHSEVENRYYALGKTNTGRTLFIVFVIRDKKIRVITARDASKKERRQLL